MKYGVGFCGAHRTGKTTLAQSVSEGGDKVFLPLHTSPIFESHGMNPARTYPISRRLFIQRQILEHAINLYGKQSSPFVTDRTPIDFAAYLLADIHNETSLTRSEEHDLEKYLGDCYESLATYFNLVIHVRPGIPLVKAEGKAALNRSYITHLDYLISGLLQGTCHLILPEHLLSLEDRVKWVSLTVFDALA